MRNRDILADPRRPERLATLQHFHEGLLGLVVQLEQAHELLQDIVFCGALQLQVDRVFGKELTQAHVLVPPVETAAKRNGWLLLAQRVITLCLMHFPYHTGHDFPDRKSTRLNSSHSQISYAVFCLTKKKISYSPFKTQSFIHADMRTDPSARTSVLPLATTFEAAITSRMAVTALRSGYGCSAMARF